MKKEFQDLRPGDRVEAVGGEIATVRSKPQKGMITGHLSVSIQVGSALSWSEAQPNSVIVLAAT